MKAIALIGSREFSDRMRNGWVLACALLWLGAIGLTSVFGLVQIGRIGVQGYERTVVSLLNLVQYVVPLIGLLLGHDLVVREREDRTLNLVLAGGVQRSRVLLGKFLGGALTLMLPLLLGFAIAGTMIKIAAPGDGLTAFLKLAASGIVLGILFLGLGLLISVVSRTRVKALVFALLTWCVAVFAFDLVAMGVVLALESPQAVREVETATDATHVRNVEDIHAAFEAGDDAASRQAARAPRRLAPWLLLNPVDSFRAVNLPRDLAPRISAWSMTLSVVLWLGLSLWAATWKLNRIDL